MARRVLAVLAFALVPAVWVPAIVLSLRDPPTAAVAGEPAAAAEAVEEERPDPPPAPRLPVFAYAAGLPIHLPSEEVEGIAFHEASMRGAVRFRPVGVCKPCRNPRFSPPPPLDPSRRYIVMDTRGRRAPPTSAVDVVVRRGAAVFAPVGGLVMEVRRYRLYGRYPDVRVAIAPDDLPGAQVILLHLEEVALRAGDRVEASTTRVGRARRLPFASQADRYVGRGLPHVHLEVVDADARRASAG